MTDLVWLSSFRVLSSRMGRAQHVFAVIVYAPLDPPEVIERLNADFAKIGERHGIGTTTASSRLWTSARGPCFEYDYYFDHTNAEGGGGHAGAAQDIGDLIMAREREVPGALDPLDVPSGISRAARRFLYS